MITKNLLRIRIVSTILCLTIWSVHEYAISLSSYTIPYLLAVFFDDAAIKTRILGLLLVGGFMLYLLMLLVTPLLLRRENTVATVVGLVIAVVLSASDLCCCVLSILELPSIGKSINLLFSLCIIVVALCQLRQQFNQYTGGQCNSQAARCCSKTGE